VNPFDDSSAYYFDVTSRLVKLVYKKPNLLPVRQIVPTNLRLVNSQDQIGAEVERVNPTLKFISETTCVVFNGLNSLFFYERDTQLRTEDPLVPETWNLLHTWMVEKSDDGRPFTCLSSILCDAILSDKCVHVLLMNVQESQESASSCKVDTLVHWLTFESDSSGKSWILNRSRVINCFNTVPDYIALEKNGQSVYLTGPSLVKFVYDSDRPVQTSQQKKTDNSNSYVSG
jgi:hypothetical protein